MSSRGRCAGRLGRSGRDLGVLTVADGSVASTRAISAWSSSKPNWSWSSFGAPTKLAALELLNDEPEAFDLRLRLSEGGAFGRERPDHPLQRLHIVWQIGKIDVHEPEVYPTRALPHRSTCR